MLRTTSLANYDAWTQGTLAFSSPVVKNAFQLMGQIWLTDTYVYSGTAAINTINTNLYNLVQTVRSNGKS